MAKQKHNIHSLYDGVIRTEELHKIWTEDFSVTFEPNKLKLFSLHKVPKFKRRFVSNW